jgi:hypothetical protein
LLSKADLDAVLLIANVIAIYSDIFSSISNSESGDISRRKDKEDFLNVILTHVDNQGLLRRPTLQGIMVLILVEPLLDDQLERAVRVHTSAPSIILTFKPDDTPHDDQPYPCVDGIFVTRGYYPPSFSSRVRASQFYSFVPIFERSAS